jgi:ankyrin repeat protein
MGGATTTTTTIISTPALVEISLEAQVDHDDLRDKIAEVVESGNRSPKVRVMDIIAQLSRELYEEGGKHHIQELLKLDLAQVKVTQHGLPLLHIAAGAGYSDDVLLLLNNGANVDLTDSDGNTALHLAAAASNPVICRLLLERGASMKIKNRHGQTPTDRARVGDIWAWKEDHDETIKVLKEFCREGQSHNPESGPR